MKFLTEFYLLKYISLFSRLAFFSLEAENHRLSQQLALAYSGAQSGYNFGPHEEIELLRTQVCALSERLCGVL